MLATSNVAQAVKGNLLRSIFSAPKSEPALKKSGGLFDESDEDDLFGEPPPPVESKNVKSQGCTQASASAKARGMFCRIFDLGKLFLVSLLKYCSIFESKTLVFIFFKHYCLLTKHFNARRFYEY